ncbi:MAG: MliC family protein [Atribacterota bacterium]|nr:MliC family protein [Atribacterota bacterium]
MNKKSFRNYFLLIICFGILSGTYFLIAELTKKDQENVFLFSCPDGPVVQINYNEKGDSAILTIGKKDYHLNRTISASGARYTDNEETVIFWEHQGEAMIEIENKVIFQHCILLNKNEQ